MPVDAFLPAADCSAPSSRLWITPRPLDGVPPPPTPPVDGIYRVGTTPMPGTIYVVSGKGGGCTDAGLSSQGFMRLPIEKLDLASFPVVAERVE